MDPLPTPLDRRPRRLADKSGLAFFLVIAALHLLAGSAAQALHPLGGLVWTELFAFLLPSLWASAGSNLRWRVMLRLDRRPRLAELVLSFLAGAAAFLVGGALSGLVSPLFPPSWLRTFDVSHLFEIPRAAQVALALLASLLAPLCEEAAFRGHLQSLMLARYPARLALPVIAALFAAVHLNPVGFAGLFVLGLLFGWLTWRSGSLWPAIVAHATNNGITSILELRASKATASLEAIDAGLAARFLLGGTAVLVGLCWLFASVTGEPEPVTEVRAVVDPTLPLSLDPRRLPRVLLWAAVAGALALLSMGAAAAWIAGAAGAAG